MLVAREEAMSDPTTLELVAQAHDQLHKSNVASCHELLHKAMGLDNSVGTLVAGPPNTPTP